MPTRHKTTTPTARRLAAALLASTLLAPAGAAIAARIHPATLKDPDCTAGGEIQAAPGTPGQTPVAGTPEYVARYGTPQDDVMHGTPGDDKFSSGDCDDRLIGGAGDDRLAAYEGDDRLEGGDGRDFLYGQQGDDALFGGDDGEPDTLYGHEGDDLLSAGGGAGATMLGGPGRDVYVGAPGYVDAFFVGGGAPDRGTDPEVKPHLRMADVIENFEALDRIRLPGYLPGNPTTTPAEGHYSVYRGGDATPELTGTWVVTWRALGEAGYHDVIVTGGDPNGRVFTNP